MKQRKTLKECTEKEREIKRGAMIKIGICCRNNKETYKYTVKTMTGR